MTERISRVQLAQHTLPKPFLAEVASTHQYHTSHTPTTTHTRASWKYVSLARDWKQGRVTLQIYSQFMTIFELMFQFTKCRA